MMSLLTGIRSNITQSVTKQTAENTSRIGVISIILLTSLEAVLVTEEPSKSNCNHSFLVYQLAEAIIFFADTACTFGIRDVTLA
jgi:hypothetical protein